MPTAPIPEDLKAVPIQLTENARTILRKRYLRRGEDGQPVETEHEMFWRVAYHVALAEAEFADHETVMHYARAYFELLTRLRFFPNSPTFTGAGTPLGQLAACFVLAIDDDMGRTESGIFQTLRNAALIQQTGGGNGFAFSRLRPKGALVRSSGGEATGPVGFLRVYDQAFGEIAQGGSRRGANMAVLRVDHPDIREFITCKTDESAITNFNISVGITDAFMRAVENDEDFELVNPQDGKVWETVRARDLFALIVKQAHHNGEPGVLFLDTANRSNPVPHLYCLESTNPCGEQWLGPFENCCLGSINLAQLPVKDGAPDWKTLQQWTELATRFLDDVVSANNYVPSVPQLAQAAHRVRRIGLGFMGLADLMYKLRVRYGSEEGQEFAGQITEFIRYHAMKTSIELAKERGAFPAIKGSIYDPDDLKWQPPTPLFPYTRNWKRPKLDWEKIVKGIKKHGIRNGAQLTVAPTGTIATVSGCEGYGCEPVFALAYIRHVNDKGRDLQLQYTSPLFEQALREAKLSEDQIKRIIEHVNLHGSCQKAPDLPDHIRHTFVVSSDITAEEHIRMQAAIQRFVDNSISKCVTGDTLVLTAQGLTPIAELSAMRLPDQFEPLTTEVATPYGMQKTDAFYYGGMRETRKVQLTYGYEIEGTPNHRVHVLDEDGQIRFARLDELKVGDTAVLYAGQQIFGEAGQPLPPMVAAAAHNGEQIEVPERMSVDLAYLLGCIISEGTIAHNVVTITSSDRSLLERLGALVTQLFGLTWRIAQDTCYDSVYRLQVNSRQLCDWLTLSLKISPNAHHKTIPTPILRASRSELSAFLRGLFLSVYMAQDGRALSVDSASRKLLRQLQALLLNCGVFTQLQRASDQAWTLTVSGEELERLAALVEFDEAWQDEQVALCGAERERRMYSYGEPVPYSLARSLYKTQERAAGSLRSSYNKQADEHRRLDDVARSHADTLVAGGQERCLYVQVESVASGFAEVFDLSVPQSHTFIANGLCNHNTCNFPPEATEEDVATAYMLGWKLGCKGLTVYVTGSREKVVLETHATAKQKEKSGDAQPEATTTALTTTQSQAAVPSSTPEPITLFPETKKPRPRRLEGRTYRIGTPLGGTYITINENGEGRGQPFEMFIHTSKAGSETAAVSEALGRLSSLIMRMASPIPPRERVKEIIRQLEGIGGDRSIGFGPQRVRSLPDGIAQVLREYLDETSDEANDRAPLPKRYVADQHLLAQPKSQLELIGELCPECGDASLVNEEGCRKCYSCGYSEC
ncbi:MAG: adenosylcobalamin-dependent ribonucleoside-diphosphate reductase [Anaerolineae bacterium]|nr:adenosylcobalamin-dependent ribonucleoside-diphosphate reductase [Anaerolineae bacterium]